MENIIFGRLLHSILFVLTFALYWQGVANGLDESLRVDMNGQLYGVMAPIVWETT